MIRRNIVGTENGFDGSSSWKRDSWVRAPNAISKGTQFRAVRLFKHANSQALSAETESALGYENNQILGLPRLPCAQDRDCSQPSGTLQSLCEVRPCVACSAFGGKHQVGREETICAYFLCGLFSGDPRLRMPHTKKSHNRHFPRLILAARAAQFIPLKGPGVITDSENRFF
jgi:hypothetical protein